MTALERLRNSDAWNHAYGIPCGNGHHNPWIYLGYAEMVLRLNGEQIPSDKLNEFYLACAVDVGLIKRWPDSTIPTSHDEVIGAAHMSREIAIDILTYLDRSGGDFNPLGLPENRPERWNLYRFPWLRPYLAACSGWRVSLFAQAAWALKLVIEAFGDADSSKTGPGPRLRAWLMAAEMRRFPLCLLAWKFYRWRIERRGCSLANDLRQEPAWPELAALAPDNYLHPGEE